MTTIKKVRQLHISVLFTQKVNKMRSADYKVVAVHDYFVGSAVRLALAHLAVAEIFLVYGALLP